MMSKAKKQSPKHRHNTNFPPFPSLRGGFEITNFKSGVDPPYYRGLSTYTGRHTGLPLQIHTFIVFIFCLLIWLRKIPPPSASQPPPQAGDNTELSPAGGWYSGLTLAGGGFSCLSPAGGGLRGWSNSSITLSISKISPCEVAHGN
jgi:hypothetical protein